MNVADSTINNGITTKQPTSVHTMKTADPTHH